MSLKQITKQNFSILLKSVEPSLDLLGRLRSVRFIEDRISDIKQQATDALKNDALLGVLCKVPDDIQESVMNEFISALRSSGQDHVANIFRRESDKIPMSEEHYRTLTGKTDQLCEFIDPENGLLNKLVSAGVISDINAQDIRSMSGYNQMARKLIEVLVRKSDDAYDGFIKALDATRQSHVTYMLTGKEDSLPLKEEYRSLLMAKQRNYLVNKTESKSSSLITVLMDKGVFSSYDQQRVTSFQSVYDRNELILDLIARKSQSDFFNFISALRETKQTHVALRLIGVDVVAKIKTMYEPETHSDDKHMSEAEAVECMQEMFQRDGDEVKLLKEHLLQNGVIVSDISKGCIEISIKVLRDFSQITDSRKLENMLNEAFSVPLAKKGFKLLTVEISAEQFERCAEMFSRWAPMTPEHHDALLSSVELLLDKIRVTSDLLDKLDLCDRRRQAIESAQTQEQVKTLIDIVSRQPDSAFEQLLNALKDTNQHEAVAIIAGESRSSQNVQLEQALIRKTDRPKQINLEQDKQNPVQIVVESHQQNSYLGQQRELEIKKDRSALRDKLSSKKEEIAVVTTTIKHLSNWRNEYKNGAEQLEREVEGYRTKEETLNKELAEVISQLKCAEENYCYFKKNKSVAEDSISGKHTSLHCVSKILHP